MNSRVFRLDVSHNVLIEELQDEWNTVCKDEMLRHEFKLVNVIDAEVFKEQQERC